MSDRQKYLELKRQIRRNDYSMQICEDEDEFDKLVNWNKRLREEIAAL